MLSTDYTNLLPREFLHIDSSILSFIEECRSVWWVEVELTAELIFEKNIEKKKLSREKRSILFLKK